jgi:4-amino-4-deoxy-L-arabinose transferase-like glycosyltransferase
MESRGCYQPQAPARGSAHPALALGAGHQRLSIFYPLSFILLGAAVYLLFFHRLADRDLWSSHEARAAMDAQTILDSGDWGLPRLFDGQAELQKPPLYYWLVAGLARLRGGEVDAWAVRLPSALAAVGCVGTLAALGWLRGRWMAGLAAGTILATAVHFTWLARIGRIDVSLTLTVSVACAAYYFARTGRIDDHQPGAPVTGRPLLALRAGLGRFPLLLLGYLALGAGVLLKGPIGLVLPAAVVGLHLLLEGELPAPWRLRAWGTLARALGLWWGLPFVGALTLPWFCWADTETGGEFFRVFFWHHNFERGLGGSTLRAHPWWLYGPYFANDFLPWTPLLPLAAFGCWRRGWWRADPELRFGAAWLLAVLAVLSCASFKRADYLLPAYPGAALLLGCALFGEPGASATGGRLLRSLTLPARRVGEPLRNGVFVAGVALAALIGWFVRVTWYLPANESFRDYRAFAAQVRRLAPSEPVVFFRTEAHALAFHVGRPLTVLVQWPDLNARLALPGRHYVIMPPASAEEWPQFLQGIRLEEVARNTDLAGGAHERPLVLLRTSEHARTADPATDRIATAERGAAGP